MSTSASANEIVQKIAQDLLELQKTYSNSFKKANLKLSKSASLATAITNISDNFLNNKEINQHISTIEEAILRAKNFPILIDETEQVSALGQRGIYANKCEANNWKGEIPLSQYTLNQDDNPQLIKKKVTHQLEYIQELAVRYLRPPTPAPPGEIIIKQEANKLTPPAPPIVIRQQPPKPKTPEPIVFREAPPPPPPAIGRKLITISGNHLPPPPRKVIIERMAPLPDKPQSVIVERWLPYTAQKRKVIFKQAPTVQDPVLPVKNVLIQWETPDVVVKTSKKYLGVVRANPVEYIKKYGDSLKASNDLPRVVLDLPTPDGITLAAEYKYNPVHELEGDIEALKLVDLESEGLSEYKSLFQNKTNEKLSKNPSKSSIASLTATLEALFKAIDKDRSGTISINEAARIVLKINSRLGRSYGEDDVINFMKALDINGDNKITFDEFRNAMILLSE